MVTRTGSKGRTRVGLGLALAAALGLGAASGRARASENLTFTLTPQATPGAIGYAGGATPLVGNDLGVSTVTGLATPLHPDAALTIGSGALNFQTGNFEGKSQSNEADFAAGGKLELDGGIAALGIAPGTALLSGAFTNETFVKEAGVGDLKIQGSAFFNVVNPTLAAYFGLPVGSSVFSGALATLFSAPVNASGGFSSSDLASGSITTSPVPEPGTFAVFAVLVGGGLAYARRGRGRAAA